MKKKLIASLFSLALSAVFALGCFAADADKVVYDGTNLTYSGRPTRWSTTAPT